MCIHNGSQAFPVCWHFFNTLTWTKSYGADSGKDGFDWLSWAQRRLGDWPVSTPLVSAQLQRADSDSTINGQCYF